MVSQYLEFAILSSHLISQEEGKLLNTSLLSSPGLKTASHGGKTELLLLTIIAPTLFVHTLVKSPKGTVRMNQASVKKAHGGKSSSLSFPVSGNFPHPNCNAILHTLKSKATP